MSLLSVKLDMKKQSAMFMHYVSLGMLWTLSFRNCGLPSSNVLINIMLVEGRFHFSSPIQLALFGLKRWQSISRSSLVVSSLYIMFSRHLGVEGRYFCLKSVSAGHASRLCLASTVSAVAVMCDDFISVVVCLFHLV